MLYIMGIGLRGTSSLTLEESELIRNSSRIFFETYTSISPSDTISGIEIMFGKKVQPIGRSEVEEGKNLIELASGEDVCLLVTGDPLSATTHNQLRSDAYDAGIEVRVLENASITSVIPGKIGLFPYRMGPPVSLPFPYDIFMPRSVSGKIKMNKQNGLHTLLLLDLRDGRTMYPYEAVETLLKMEKKYGVGALDPKDRIFSISRVSQDGEKLIYDTAANVMELRLEESPASLVIPAELNHNEEKFVEKFTKGCSYFR